MSNIVEVNNLVKQYPGAAEPAVRGVSFAIKQGEIFGFLGPNGAGKTTTISMLSCLLTPTSGTAMVAGFDLVKQADQVKHHIGLVPQELALYPTTLRTRQPEFLWPHLRPQWQSLEAARG